MVLEIHHNFKQNVNEYISRYLYSVQLLTTEIAGNAFVKIPLYLFRMNRFSEDVHNYIFLVKIARGLHLQTYAHTHTRVVQFALLCVSHIRAL